MSRGPGYDLNSLVSLGVASDDDSDSVSNASTAEIVDVELVLVDADGNIRPYIPAPVVAHSGDQLKVENDADDQWGGGSDVDSIRTASSIESIDEMEEVLIDRDGNVYPVTVNIHSLDGDGCFLPYSTKNIPLCTMAQYNLSFVSELLAGLNAKKERTIFLTGSARQCWLRDLTCVFQRNERGVVYKTESYFFALQQFVKDINEKLPAEKHVILDPFLLNDVFFNKPSGDSFHSAQQYGSEWSDIIKGPFDESTIERKVDEIRQKMATIMLRAIEEQKNAYDSLGFFWETFNRFPLCENPGKFALLYSQVHHIASQHLAETQLNFHFYDDRLDILWPLVAVFLHMPELLPKNMTLYFHYYVNGRQQWNPENHVPVVKEVKGRGMVDLHYRETLRDMVSKLDVSNVNVGGVELSLRLGNPLDRFFEIVSQGEFDLHRFLHREVTVLNRDTFIEFNKDRFIRMGVIEEQSFASFFSKMKRLGLALQNDDHSSEVQGSSLGASS